MAFLGGFTNRDVQGEYNAWAAQATADYQAQRISRMANLGAADPVSTTDVYHPGRDGAFLQGDIGKATGGLPYSKPLYDDSSTGSRYNEMMPPRLHDYDLLAAHLPVMGLLAMAPKAADRAAIVDGLSASGIQAVSELAALAGAGMPKEHRPRCAALRAARSTGERRALLRGGALQERTTKPGEAVDRMIQRIKGAGIKKPDGSEQFSATMGGGDAAPDTGVSDFFDDAGASLVGGLSAFADPATYIGIGLAGAGAAAATLLSGGAATPLLAPVLAAGLAAAAPAVIEGGQRGAASQAAAREQERMKKLEEDVPQSTGVYIL